MTLQRSQGRRLGRIHVGVPVRIDIGCEVAGSIRVETGAKNKLQRGVGKGPHLIASCNNTHAQSKPPEKVNRHTLNDGCQTNDKPTIRKLNINTNRQNRYKEEKMTSRTAALEMGKECDAHVQDLPFEMV
jgi:hypothetical protein